MGNPYEAMLRRRLSEAQNHRCCYCGTCVRKNPTLEHVQARKHGGRSTYANCVVACRACNCERGHSRPFRFWYGKQREMRKAA